MSEQFMDRIATALEEIARQMSSDHEGRQVGVTQVLMELVRQVSAVAQTVDHMEALISNNNKDRPGAIQYMERIADSLEDPDGGSVAHTLDRIMIQLEDDNGISIGQAARDIADGVNP